VRQYHNLYCTDKPSTLPFVNVLQTFYGVVVRQAYASRAGKALFSVYAGLKKLESYAFFGL